MRGEGLGDRKQVKSRTNNRLFSMVQPGWRDRPLGCEPGLGPNHHHHPHPTPPQPGPKMSMCTRGFFLLLMHPPCGPLPRGLTGSGTQLSGASGTAYGSASDTPAPVPTPTRLAGSWLPALLARLVMGGRWSGAEPRCTELPGGLAAFFLILTAHCPVRTQGQGDGATSSAASHNWAV